MKFMVSVSEIVSAYHEGGFAAIQNLLQRPTLSSTDKQELLMSACLRGDLPSVEAILQNNPGLDLNFSLDISKTIYPFFTWEFPLIENMSPLMAAVESKNKDLINYLVMNKAKVSYSTENYDAVLMALISSDDIEIVKQIFAHLQSEDVSLDDKDRISKHLFSMLEILQMDQSEESMRTNNIRELLQYPDFDFSITWSGKDLIQYANEMNCSHIANMISLELESRKYDIFALIVFFSDGLLQPNEEAEHQNTRRFLKIAARLSLELQMVLCERLNRSTKDIILTKYSEPAFRRLAILYQNKTRVVPPPAPLGESIGERIESPRDVNGHKALK